MKKIIGLLAISTVIITGCSSNSNNTNNQGNKENNNQNNASLNNNNNNQGNSDQKPAEQNNNAANTNIDVQEIIKVFKNNAADYNIKSIEVNLMNPANPNYIIEGINANNELKATIDNNKQFIKINEELLDIEDRNGAKANMESIDLNSIKDLNQIISIAKNQIPGGVVQKVSLDKDNGVTYWEIDLNGQEIKIDNNTLSIIEISN